MQIILVAHGKFATELHNTLEMIVGEAKHFHPVNFYAEEGPDNLRARIEEVVKLNSGTKYLFLVDLFGGTPFNVSSALSAEDENISVVAGMNLPMLLELAFPLDETVEVLMEKAIAAGKEGVKPLKLEIKQTVEVDGADDEF